MAAAALKTRNSIIFGPHPRGINVCKVVVDLFRKELAKLGLPEDLVLCLEEVSLEDSKHMTVEECMDVIRRDKGYYDRSGGGVTVSGGDPLVQSDFVAALFKQCKEEGFQTCLESTFYSKWEEAEKILPYTDIIISDLKHMDTKVHRKWTGVHNERILENLKRITDDNREFILRIPVIPGINDDKKNIEASADFILNELQGRIRVLQLLSFMRLGEEKYASLNMPYQMDFIDLDRESFTEHVNEIADYFNSEVFTA